MTEEVKAASRQQRRLEKAQEQVNKQEPARETAPTKQTKWVQIRMFPIWLRILIVLILLMVAAAAGLMVGYGVIGEGKPMDALKWETYQHILDIKDGK